MNASSAIALSSAIRLADGRMLGVAEFGARDGRPLFYFHGLPGSRLEARVLDDAATRCGTRVVGIDRPGMGRSTFKPGRRLLDWPDDVATLADRMHIDRLAVVGCSGGGPYAMACALKLGPRLTACGVVSGAGVVGPFLAMLSRHLPPLVMPPIRYFVRDDAKAAQTLRYVSRRWPEADRRALAKPAVAESWAMSLAEAFRQGAHGPAHDARLLGTDWGFDLAALTSPAIRWWHGEQDRLVPVRLARAAVARLAQCQAVYYPAEGHVSVIVNHADEIVQTLMSR